MKLLEPFALRKHALQVLEAEKALAVFLRLFHSRPILQFPTLLRAPPIGVMNINFLNILRLLQRLLPIPPKPPIALRVFASILLRVQLVRSEHPRGLDFDFERAVVPRVAPWRVLVVLLAGGRGKLHENRAAFVFGLFH